LIGKQTNAEKDGDQKGIEGFITGVPKLFQCADHVKYLRATLVLREAQNVDVYGDSRTT
jgi:hypothetical protein